MRAAPEEKDNTQEQWYLWYFFNEYWLSHDHSYEDQRKTYNLNLVKKSSYPRLVMPRHREHDLVVRFSPGIENEPQITVSYDGDAEPWGWFDMTGNLHSRLYGNRVNCQLPSMHLANHQNGYGNHGQGWQDSDHVEFFSRLGHESIIPDDIIYKNRITKKYPGFDEKFLSDCYWSLPRWLKNGAGWGFSEGALLEAARQCHINPYGVEKSSDTCDARTAQIRATMTERISRDVVIERDGFVCYLCRKEVSSGDIHIDHKMPLSRGGSHTYDNLGVTHSTCNLQKHAMTPEEYWKRYPLDKRSRL